MIRSTHVLIQLQERHPPEADLEILPGQLVPSRRLSGDGKVEVRVIEYFTGMKAQEVPFCLVTDLMDWDSPAPHWPRSESRVGRVRDRAAGGQGGPARRRAGHRATCSFPGSPNLVRQELRRLGRRHRDDPQGRPRRRPRRRARAQGTPRRADGPATRPVLRPRRPGGPVRDPPRARLLPGRDQRNRAPGSSLTGTGTATASRSPPSSFAHAGPATRLTRSRRHHHGQHPRLNSRNTKPPERQPQPDRGPGRRRHDTPTSGMPAQKAATRSNQKQELPTTGQTPKDFMDAGAAVPGE